MDISFIIPVYNVEQFIAKAILSIIDTQWEDLQYEIIIVDDESPDNSVKVINEIILTHPTISINFISQKNKGLGGARNTGMAIAKGQYLFFLDSDDYIISETFPALLHIAKTHELDVLEFAASRVDENYQLIDNIFFNTTNDSILSGNEYVKNIDFANSACNKLYNNIFLKKNNIVFLERVYIEDAPFNVEVFSNAFRVMAVDMIGAVYYQNMASITRSKRTSEYLTKFINDSIIVTEKINLLSSSYKDNRAKDIIKKKVACFVSGILWMILKGNGLKLSEKKILIKSLREKLLFPYYHTTGFLSRNIFLFIFNLLGTLRIL